MAGDVKLRPVTGLPDKNVPVIFADGVAHFVNSREIAKTVLFRTDAEIGNTEVYENRVAAQIIMPITGVVNLFVLYEQSIERLIKTGILDPRVLYEARATQKDIAGQA